MMKCRGMGAAMRKMGGGSMKPVAMKEGKMVERKQMGQGIARRSDIDFRSDVAALLAGVRIGLRSGTGDW